MSFDDYLCKPVEREDVRAAVDQQCKVLAYDLLGEYFQLESKRAVIEAELPSEELDEHDEFNELEDRTGSVRERVDRLLPNADALFSEFSGIDRKRY